MVKDIRGSIEQQTGKKGLKGLTYQYTAFVVEKFPMNLNDIHGFTGYVRDRETDSYYANARQYLPQIHRFMAKDKLRVDSLNRYLYVVNNPVNFVDPSGLKQVLGTTTEYVYDDKNEVVVNTRKNEDPIPVDQVEKILELNSANQQSKENKINTAQKLSAIGPGSEAMYDAYFGCQEPNDNSYIGRSIKQVWYGNYTDDVTALGTAMQVGLGATGVDLPCDARDIYYDITHYEDTSEWKTQTALDTVSIIPFIGAAKYLDEISDCFKSGKKLEKVAKHSDEVVDLAYHLSKNAKHHISKHIPSKFANEVKHLTDEQLISKLNKNSYFNPEWSEEKIYKVVEEAYNTLRKERKIGKQLYKVEGEEIRLFIGNNGELKSATGLHKLTKEFFGR